MSRQIRGIAVCTLILFSFSVPILAQESSTVKEKAETELQKMSPEQVDAKIKEVGMTRAEAEAKAKEYGIDLQQYLNTRGAATQTQPGLLGTPQVQTQTDLQTATQALSPQQLQRQFDPLTPMEQPKNRQQPVEPLKSEPIPGFTGRTGVAGIELFGYNIFNFPSSTFEPVLNVPTPQSYTLGPGDEVILTMWGETQMYTQLTITREGEIVIPNVGPVIAQGVTIAQLKSRLLARMTSSYAGLRGGANGANTWMDLSIGKLRSMQIFVLGEVRKPGGYAVSSMSTALLGLYVAGGPTVNGSLRNVQVLRDNKLISTIDFYDFALKGDRSKDIRLQDGDVVYVKPAGERVALTGLVVRPAIYELKNGEKLGNLIALAGGVQANTYTDRVHIERIIPFAERKNYKKNILDVDVKLSTVDDLLHSTYDLENGDIVSVLKINEFFQNRVTINGNVKKPGVFELHDGMTVRDLVQQADGYLSDTFADRANILRTLPDLRKEIVPFSLAKAMEGDSLNNIALESEDEVTIFNKQYFFPDHPVLIAGSVRHPGSITRAENMKLTDLLVAAGGLTEDAETDQLIVTRIDTTSQIVYSQTFTIKMSPDYWKNDREQSFELKDYDYVFVPANPKYHRTKFVTVHGEVTYPGTYALLYDGERLASIIKRAGGLKDNAYIEGARLTRTAGGAGLVPVNFRDALENPSDRLNNIQIVEGDQIEIDRNPGVVYVRGEVGVPSAVVYEPGASLNYYLNQAGGVKETGDLSKTVVMQPNGRKWTTSWFFFPNSEILAGATISVPPVVEKENKTLPILRDWATIFVSIATMMVAIIQISK